MTEPDSRPRRTISIIDDPEYWKALGHFIEAFATAETVLFHTLAFCAGTSISTAKAIFPGTRTDQAIKSIHRLFEARPALNAEMKSELTDVLTHLKWIADARNLIVHYSSVVTSDKARIVSDITRALKPKNIKEQRVCQKILNAMTDDVTKIAHHLAMICAMPNASLAEKARELPVLNDAWQYTPDEQPNQKKAEQGGSKGLPRRLRKRPRAASPQ